MSEWTGSKTESPKVYLDYIDGMPVIAFYENGAEVARFRVKELLAMRDKATLCDRLAECIRRLWRVPPDDGTLAATDINAAVWMHAKTMLADYDALVAKEKNDA